LPDDADMSVAWWGPDLFNTRGRAATAAWITLLVGVCALGLIDPGSAPFGADESELINYAIKANEAGRLAEHGVLGTRRLHYGPVPVWFYQLALRFTHDLVKISIMRTVLVTLVTVLSLIWLASTLRLHRWFIAALMLSPFLWFYSRQLWDNSFNVPLCALAAASYVDFLNRRRPWTLLLAMACPPVMLLIHPMAAALAAALAAHMLIFQRQALWRYRWQVGFMLIIGAAFIRPLLMDLWILEPSELPHRQGINGWWYALSGPSHFSGVGLSSFFQKPWHDAMGQSMATTFRTAIAISTIAFALCWTGGAVTILRWTLLLRHREQPNLRDHAACLALMTIVAQLVLNGMTKTWGHPQYFNATWIAFAIMAWLSVNRIASIRPAAAHSVIAIYATSLAGIIVVLLIHLNQTAGTRDTHHGPTLNAQLQLAREIARYDSQSKITTDIKFFHNARQAIPTLQRLASPAQHPLKPAILHVEFASDNPANARLKLTPSQMTDHGVQ